MSLRSRSRSRSRSLSRSRSKHSKKTKKTSSRSQTLWQTTFGSENCRFDVYVYDPDKNADTHYVYVGSTTTRSCAHEALNKLDASIRHQFSKMDRYYPSKYDYLVVAVTKQHEQNGFVRGYSFHYRSKHDKPRAPRVHEVDKLQNLWTRNDFLFPNLAHASRHVGTGTALDTASYIDYFVPPVQPITKTSTRNVPGTGTGNDSVAVAKINVIQPSRARPEVKAKQNEIIQLETLRSQDQKALENERALHARCIATTQQLQMQLQELQIRIQTLQEQLQILKDSNKTTAASLVQVQADRTALARSLGLAETEQAKLQKELEVCHAQYQTLLRNPPQNTALFEQNAALARQRGEQNRGLAQQLEQTRDEFAATKQDNAELRRQLSQVKQQQQQIDPRVLEQQQVLQKQQQQNAALLQQNQQLQQRLQQLTKVPPPPTESPQALQSLQKQLQTNAQALQTAQQRIQELSDEKDRCIQALNGFQADQREREEEDTNAQAAQEEKEAGFRQEIDALKVELNRVVNDRLKFGQQQAALIAQQERELAQFRSTQNSSAAQTQAATKQQAALSRQIALQEQQLAQFRSSQNDVQAALANAQAASASYAAQAQEQAALRREIAQLNTAKAAEAQRFQQALAAAQQEMAILRSQACNVNEVNALKQNLGAEQQRSQRLQQQINSAQQVQAQLQQEVNVQRGKIQSLTQDLEKQNGEKILAVQRGNLEAQQLQRANSELSKQIAVYKGQQAQLATIQQSQLAEREDARHQIQLLRQQLANLQSSYTQLDEVYKQNENTFRNAVEKQKQLKQENGSYRNEIDKLRAQVQYLQAPNTAVNQNALAVCERARDRYQALFSTHTSDTQTLKDARALLSHEYDQMVRKGNNEQKG